MSLSNSLSRSLSRPISRSLYVSALEAETVAFADTSGATDLIGINAIVSYLKQESLYDSARLYTMKSSQNAGSGATVYGIGGLTSNNMTLVNSPTWGTDGVNFVAASSHYGTVTDFLAAEEITVFSRVALTDVTPTSVGYVISQFNFGAANDRSWVVFNDIANDIDIIKSSDGGSTNADRQQTTSSVLSDGVEETLVVDFENSQVPRLWYSKTSISTSRQSGSLQTARHNSAADVISMAGLNNGTPSEFCGGVKVCDMIITSILTTTQRETLTDLVNAL